MPKCRKSGDILSGKYMQRNYNCKFTEQIVNEKEGKDYYKSILVKNICSYVKTKLLGPSHGNQ